MTQPDEHLSNAKRLHDQAMSQVDQALVARRQGREANARGRFLAAFCNARDAASVVSPHVGCEPTRSVLHRSAAALAINCGKTGEALRLIEAGLAGNPPEEIAQELRELRKGLNDPTEAKPDRP